MNDQQHPCPDEFPFSMFTFSTHENEPNSPIGRIIACVHAIWSHMGIAKLSGLSGLLRVCTAVFHRSFSKQKTLEPCERFGENRIATSFHLSSYWSILCKTRKGANSRSDRSCY